MKELKKVSRWISVNGMEVTKNHSLYCYGEDTENGKRYVYTFRYNGRLYALDQFLNRFGMLGFDKECKEYPKFIIGYDGENYFNPLLIEIDECGEKVRLWREV